MPRPLHEAVVAITGASSGVGRAAALRFARRGSRLALCARAEAPLRQVAEECEATGAEVLVRPLDVAEEAEVESFAAATVACFGRLDVWVNNAGVIAYGEFTEIPSEVFRGVVETNLMGQVHGARAALPRFRAQGGGVLINMSSVWGRVSSPLVSPYVLSKNAVRAFSECLRGELVDSPGIYVTSVAPQAIDTPIFDHGANYTGRRLRPIPPMLSVERVAEGIEACAESAAARGHLRLGRAPARGPLRAGAAALSAPRPRRLHRRHSGAAAGRPRPRQRPLAEPTPRRRGLLAPPPRRQPAPRLSRRRRRCGGGPDPPLSEPLGYLWPGCRNHSLAAIWGVGASSHLRWNGASRCTPPPLPFWRWSAR